MKCIDIPPPFSSELLYLSEHAAWSMLLDHAAIRLLMSNTSFLHTCLCLSRCVGADRKAILLLCTQFLLDLLTAEGFV